MTASAHAQAAKVEAAACRARAARNSNVCARRAGTQEIDRKAAEKLATEQAAEAARIKEIADKLAKEKANRDAELERLVTQYQKLTDGQQSTIDAVTHGTTISSHHHDRF